MKKQREAFEKWAKSEYPNNSALHFEWTERNSHYVLDETQFAFEAWQSAQADKLDFAWKVALALQKAIVSELNSMEVCNCCNDASDIPAYCAETAGDINDEDIAVIIAKVEQEK